MSRFQATIDPPTEQELEYLREYLGLREDQKANLLREIARLASWCVRQASAGRHIMATAKADQEQGEELGDPILDRLRQGAPRRLVLDPQEVERLEALLTSPIEPSPALVRALENLAHPQRQPPAIQWEE